MRNACSGLNVCPQGCWHKLVEMFHIRSCNNIRLGGPRRSQHLCGQNHVDIQRMVGGCGASLVSLHGPQLRCAQEGNVRQREIAIRFQVNKLVKKLKRLRQFQSNEFAP